ncbi:MAG: hypothetical protein EBR52_00380 [Microbacteriaceae bacterium]|nr:hypothetical protein [Microbacteriaceae bacterium]
MKKLIIWIASLVAVMLVVIGHFVVFGVTDTGYEKWLRSQVASTVRGLSTLDSNDFQYPVVVDQSYLIEDSLIAMSDKLVYHEGEVVSVLTLSRDAGTMTVSTVDPSARTIVGHGEFPANKTGAYTTVRSLTGFNRGDFFAQPIEVPDGYTGWLQIEVKAGADVRNIPVFIQSSHLTADTLFIDGTNTLKAYISGNGLRNNYANPLNLAGDFSRPVAYPMDYFLISPTSPEFTNTVTTAAGDIDSALFSCTEHLINANFALKSALSAHRVSFDNATDDYLAENPVPSHYKLLVFGAHDEYWSDAMFDHVTQFVDRGGSVLFLGGNNAWRFVESTSDGYQLFWGNGAQSAKQQEFIDQILGTYWDMRGYNTFASMTTQNAAPEFSSDVTAGTTFGDKLLVPQCSSRAPGISGYETDKLRDTASKSFSILAKGNNPWFGGAEVVTRQTDAGGTIVNFSSTGSWQGVNDATVNHILDAFLNKALH